MRILFSVLILLFISPNLHSQVRKNIIWFTEKSGTTNHGFNEGQVAPNLSIKDVNKRRFNLYDELDKVTIIDFRNMKCQACTKNNKYLKQFYKQYNIEIISIYDDARAVLIKDFAKKNGMLWINVQDDELPKKLLRKQIGLDESPDYIVLSPDKKVLKVFKSERDIGKLGVFLQKYFAD